MQSRYRRNELNQKKYSHCILFCFVFDFSLSLSLKYEGGQSVVAMQCHTHVDDDVDDDMQYMICTIQRNNDSSSFVFCVCVLKLDQCRYYCRFEIIIIDQNIMSKKAGTSPPTLNQSFCQKKMNFLRTALCVGVFTKTSTLNSTINNT